MATVEVRPPAFPTDKAPPRLAQPLTDPWKAPSLWHEHQQGLAFGKVTREFRAVINWPAPGFSSGQTRERETVKGQVLFGSQGSPGLQKFRSQSAWNLRGGLAGFASAANTGLREKGSGRLTGSVSGRPSCLVCLLLLPGVPPRMQWQWQSAAQAAVARYPWCQKFHHQ